MLLSNLNPFWIIQKEEIKKNISAFLFCYIYILITPIMLTKQLHNSLFLYVSIDFVAGIIFIFKNMKLEKRFGNLQLLFSVYLSPLKYVLYNVSIFFLLIFPVHIIYFIINLIIFKNIYFQIIILLLSILSLFLILYFGFSLFLIINQYAFAVLIYITNFGLLYFFSNLLIKNNYSNFLTLLFIVYFILIFTLSIFITTKMKKKIIEKCWLF